ncbi:L-histidine N(alpha)-methyltransferase [Rubrobacter indicoceani]|uniref:L-histidine N(alpha)-methyltransferase n=1 Tax=Rubrobacter indicoceani TaxID=2051957 RepID=UPI0013C4B58E|nr:L-histidine N(alpha)-methyltransferase [Rubrobacter indicoceani]
MSERSGEISVTTLGSAGDEFAEMVRDIKAGLQSEPKDLSRWPKYLYDDEGSRLFEEITVQPEYYQTRTELAILQEYSAEIIAGTGCREIIELGSGSSTKTRTLIEAMLAHTNGSGATYSPLDVSEGILVESGETLMADYPDLDVRGYVGDFGGGSVGRVLAGEPEGGERLVVFLGGTIGNFVPEERTAFLEEIGAALAPDDALLLGMDLVKDRETLEAAYDDAAGITASFNKNLLSVLNDRLAGEFDVEKFTHRSVYDKQNERIEMWLHSREALSVKVGKLETEFHFEAGEGVRTELSHKFTRRSVESTLEQSGLDLVELYTDEKERFSLALAKRGRN